MLIQILGQILGHTLGQGSDQNPLILFGSQADLGEHIIHLGSHRTHLYNRIQQTCGTNNLLDHLSGRLFQLIVGRRSRHKDGLGL